MGSVTVRAFGLKLQEQILFKCDLKYDRIRDLAIDESVLRLTVRALSDRIRDLATDASVLRLTVRALSMAYKRDDTMINRHY